MIKRLFCDKWEFAETSLGTEYDKVSGWRAVDLPHDWLIYDVNALYRDSTGWYRRKLHHKDDGLRTILRFDGVYMDCRVYVNGECVCGHINGYTTFDADITEHLSAGENLIAVRVDHRSPNSRWYSGAGIYRNVWLCRCAETHILSDGVYVSADTDGNVTVTVEAERPAGQPIDELTLRTAVLDGDKVLAEREYYLTAADSSLIPAHLTRSGCKYSVNEQNLTVSTPELWSPEHPKLYTLLAEIKRCGDVVDSVRVRFGFRSAEFTTDRGFFLNGKNIKLHGCCEHHDLGALGTAVNKAALRRKLLKLRSMGCNAIRTTHNPPAPELMELTDEMGFFVLSEFTDVWKISKTEYDYARHWDKCFREDIASWVRRDRNCPSVIAWSSGNEIPDTGADESGQETASLMRSLVRQHDPRGNGGITIGSNQMRSENGRKCADILKLAGYNYSEELYAEHHAAHPDWCIYGSETSSILSSRGVYHAPLSEAILEEDDGQCSGLGNSRPIWAAKNWEYCIIPERDLDYCSGQFIWSGFDYIGETYPYKTKNCYYGQFDTAGFPKDGVYVFRSAWIPHEVRPMVHIFGNWQGTEGELIDVRVISNAPNVELYLGGELVKKQHFDRRNGKELFLDVRIPYQREVLTAVARDEDGSETARDEQRPFGDAVLLEAVPDKTELLADGRDMIFIEMAAYDKVGVFCANANDRVTVEVSGEGRLVGLDNGDSTDFEQYKGVSRRLFSGRLLAMIAAKQTAGDITVKLTSPTLGEKQLSLKAVPAALTEGVSCSEENMPRKCICGDISRDIPVRAIEFVGERLFTPERRVIRLETLLYPANAVYRDIEYKLVCANGLPCSSAVIKESDEHGVTVECLGDGGFYLKARCGNGGEYGVMAAVSLAGEGLGTADLDAYTLIEGGRYTLSGGEVINGIEHGARLGREGGYIGFERVDLGTLGSDSITLPIFALTGSAISLRIYDGTPENGELLGEYTYCKPSEWLVYQPETYRLPGVLRGVHTISIAADAGLDIGGIMFGRRVKERTEIFASDCVSIHGDSFTKTSDAITGIGNNVIVSFGEFDFGSCPPSRIVINGRTDLPQNSIELMTEGDTERRIECRFAGGSDYGEQAFPVSGISGRVRVSLVFLPGCCFDLKSFRFEYDS